MKLDKDGSGSIDKDEFLQIPQIATNPLAHRMIAIFDEEYVCVGERRGGQGRGGEGVRRPPSPGMSEHEETVPLALLSNLDTSYCLGTLPS